ncbi:MAG: ArsR/SmtB family transcription factor [Dehalococcoidia bacterium]
MRPPLRQFKADFFKALAHPGRIKIIESLRSGEKTVGELQALLDGESTPASQHLALLRSKGIVSGQRNGNNVHYTVRDPMVFELLDVARKIFNAHLIDTQELLKELTEEEETVSGTKPTGG